MLIECLIKRDGPTPVTIEKFSYLFKPQPEITGDDVAPVCNVNSADHQQRLISTGLYRAYMKPEVKPQQVQGPKEPQQVQETKETEASKDITEVVGTGETIDAKSHEEPKPPKGPKSPKSSTTAPPLDLASEF